MSSRTLYIGWRWPTTSTEAPTATVAISQNRTVSIVSQSLRTLRAEAHEHVRRDEQVDHRGRQQPLPAELHQLVVAVARQRPAHPEIEEEQERDLRQEPD